MRIQHNISAMNSYRNFSANNSKLNKNLEKLSTGYKINRAGDDAAGLAISEKMRAQISGIEGATKNAKDGISLIQTAEGALTEVHDMLNRMTTLAEQSANGTYDDDVDRNQLQKEITALKDEIDRIADSTNYNGLKLLDGSLGGSTENKVAEVSGARLQNHVIDATKATTTATMGAVTLSSGAALTDVDNAQYTLNVGLSDGRSVAVDLTVKKEGSNYNLVGSDGKVYGQMAVTSTTAASNALRDAFAKAAKDTELGDTFDITASTTAGDGKIVFKAKEAGKEGLTVTSADVKIDFTNVADKSKGVTAVAASNVEATQGTDKSQGFDVSKLMAYNAKANGGKGNANKAVFEVNGVKFAIGSFDQDLKDLGNDVNYISLKTTATPGTTGFSMASVNSTGTETAAGFKVSEAGAKMIAHEISQKAGVTVEYASLAAGTAIDDTDKVATGGMKVFKVGDVIGTEGKGLTLQIGDTSDSYNKMTVNVSDMHAEAIGLGDLDISSQEGASKALDQIKNAVNMVSDVRGSLGALQNRLDHTINNLGVMRENIQNAESLIRDTDVAEEMMTYTKNNILNQSAQAMLAQANQLPQGVLQLLG